jgi:hypothetical protein
MEQWRGGKGKDYLFVGLGIYSNTLQFLLNVVNGLVI